jgi:hypothetical protein
MALTFNPDWARVLSGLGQGLMQAGQPGANLGHLGSGLMQGAQAYDAGVDRKKDREFREFQIQQAKEAADAQRLANTEAAETARRRQELLARIGQQGPMAAGGMSAPSGPMQLGYNQAEVFELFPELGEKYLAQQMMPKEADTSAPTVKDFYEGGKVIQKQWDPTKRDWVKVGEGARWEPNAPASSDGIWEQYIDPKSGRTGQKNTKTGKIDWDPGSTMMVQTGTDQNGNPIYDMVSTSPGKPPSEANIQAGIRGTLVEGAIKNIRDITSDLGAKISPLRMAAADTIGEKGPLGAYGANVLRTDDEKKYSAAISKGVEGLVAAITGAGVAKDQFPRIQSLIPGPTDSPEVVNWKLDQLMPILDTLVAGSGPLALSKNATPATPSGPKTPADMTDDELMKELGQ